MSSKKGGYTLGDITTLITDGKHGDCKNEKDSSYYFLSAKDIKDGRLNYENARQIEKIDFEETDKRTNLQPEDILFTNSGTIGRMAIVPNNELTRKTTFQKSVAIIKPKKDVVFPKYLFYLLKKENSRICIFAEGTTQKNLLLKDLRSFHIGEIPELYYQKAIAHLLGTLDEKIKLIKITNKTLEDIAKALFKSWFIDFDPVKTKAEGYSTKLPEEIRDIFPDSFEDSELGEIPYSWGDIPLSDLIISIKERQEEQNLDEFSATISGIEHRDKKFKKVLAKSSKKNKVAIEGDLVFGLSRTVLNFGRMPYSIGGFSSVYEVFRSKDKSNIPTEIIEKYIRTKMSKFMNILKPAAREGQAIDRDVLLQKRIPKFPSDLFHYFQSITKSIDAMISLKSKEIDSLEEIRDKLTTKLISGELRIPDAEKMIEDIGI